MHKHTKIIATISDKRCDVPFLQELFEAGLNVVRLNSAHLNEEGFLKIIRNVREVSDEIAILVDTKERRIVTRAPKPPTNPKRAKGLKSGVTLTGFSPEESLDWKGTRSNLSLVPN